MKKIIFSAALLIAVLIGCKTKSNSSDSKTLSLTFESKSNSAVTGTATFTEKKGQSDFYGQIIGLDTWNTRYPHSRKIRLYRC